MPHVLVGMPTAWCSQRHENPISSMATCSAGHILPAAVLNVASSSEAEAVAAALLAKLFAVRTQARMTAAVGIHAPSKLDHTTFPSWWKHLLNAADPVLCRTCHAMQEGCGVVALDAAGQQATLVALQAVAGARAALARHHARQAYGRQRGSARPRARGAPAGEAPCADTETQPLDPASTAGQGLPASNGSSTSTSSVDRKSRPTQSGEVDGSVGVSATHTGPRMPPLPRGEWVIGMDIAVVLECGMRGSTAPGAQEPLLVNR